MSHGGAILTVDIDADNLVIRVWSNKSFDRITGFTELTGCRYDATRVTSQPRRSNQMSFSARYLPAVLLTILSLPISLWAQTTPKQATKALRGSIFGRVTIKEKGAQGVVVSLRKADSMNPFEQALKATSDQDGFYKIARVPPGSYEVTPSAPAFVPAD